MVASTTDKTKDICTSERHCRWESCVIYFVIWCWWHFTVAVFLSRNLTATTNKVPQHPIFHIEIPYSLNAFNSCTAKAAIKIQLSIPE